MSIVKTYDVFCDGCEVWTNGVSGAMASYQPATKARECAANVGWKFLKGRDYCPGCALMFTEDMVKDVS